MAKVNLENDYPQISRPVGSSAEVMELDVPLRNVATCCAHRNGEDGAMGCPMWAYCDRSYKGTRPRMEVMKTINKEGGLRVYQSPCFDNIAREVQLAAQGGYSEVLADETSEENTFLTRGSVKLNQECPDCARGDCNRTHKYEDRDDIEETCAPFPMAREHAELKRFALVMEARTRGFMVKNKKAAEQLLSDHDTENARIIRRGKHDKPSV